MTRLRGATYYRTPVAPLSKRIGIGAVSLLVVAAVLPSLRGAESDSVAAAEPARHVTKPKPGSATRTPAATRALTGAINPTVPGLTTFRGNLTRSYYGEGPVPRRAPRVLWRYPRAGGMCASSADETGTQTWCGVGWTGQPNVIPRPSGRVEVRFGAYDRSYHFLDGARGRPVRASLATGDLAKGSATSDPDGYPLYYAGSRDNKLRIVALDRGRRPTVLWSLDANTSVSQVVWNNDWDGAPLVVRDHLLVGSENSWFYVVKLNRRYDKRGRVQVRPRVVLTVPSWDAQLLSDRPDRAYSIENSVAFHDGVAYFANSAGLVQGWDLRRTFKGKRGARRVFRFWTGEDTDASIVIDAKGFLYVASELERFTARARKVGQLMKLNPRRPAKPLVWSVRLPAIGAKGGSWSTPALDRGMVYVATHAGGLVAVDRRSGSVRWRVSLPGPTWGSPVVVDNVLLQGDCRGVLHAYDVAKQGIRPRQLWQLSLGGCIEATPAVWRGRIYIGTRGGAMYALGRRT